MQQQQLIDVQRLNVRQAQLNAGVAIDGTYTYTYFNNSGVEFHGSDSTVMLSATFPLFDAGASHDAIVAARAQLDATVDQYEVIRQALRTQIEEDASNRAGALDQTHLAQAAVSAAQSSFDSEVAQLQEGLATVFDISTADVTLTQAQNQYVTALYSFYNFDAALQRDLGINEVAPVSTPSGI
jgi:outer membrane protein TolC